MREYVVEHLGDPGAVLIVDGTGFLKKGIGSAGVQRQYSGTAGRTENCQVGVFLAYAAPLGCTLIDRRLYLPASWTDDRERCRRAGIDDEVEFATKVAMAKAMVRRTIADKIPCGWVTADAGYGYSKGWRSELEQADVFPVMATTRHDTVVTRWAIDHREVAGQGRPSRVPESSQRHVFTDRPGAGVGQDQGRGSGVLYCHANRFVQGDLIR